MKIRFVRAPDGGRKREFKVGDEVDLAGAVGEGYARKYIERGWAEEVKPEVAAPSEEEVAYRAEGVEVAAQAQVLRTDRFKSKR